MVFHFTIPHADTSLALSNGNTYVIGILHFALPDGNTSFTITLWEYYIYHYQVGIASSDG